MKELTRHNIKYFAYKNLLLVSFMVFCLGTALLPLQDLQTSLYSEDGLGFMSLCFIYIGMALGSLFLPTICLNKCGPKTTITLSVLGYFVFITVNFYGRYHTLLPAGFIFGVCTGILYSAISFYIKELARKYAEFTSMSEGEIFGKFYPIYFSIFKLSQISGNMFSSNLLHYKRPVMDKPTSNTTCGASFCPYMELPEYNVIISQSMLFTLICISLAFTCIAFILPLFFINNIRDENLTGKNLTKASLIISILKEMKDIRMALLTPILFFSGLQCGLIYSDFTQAYITCHIGIDKIGWVMTIFGIGSFSSAMFYSLLAKHVGPFSILIATVFVHVTLLAVLLNWNAVSVYSLYPYLIIAGLYGACDSSWRTQLPVLVRNLFVKHKEVFALVEFWKALGFAVYFAYGKEACVNTKIYTALDLCQLVCCFVQLSTVGL